MIQKNPKRGQKRTPDLLAQSNLPGESTELTEETVETGNISEKPRHLETQKSDEMEEHPKFDHSDQPIDGDIPTVRRDVLQAHKLTSTDTPGKEELVAETTEATSVPGREVKPSQSSKPHPGKEEQDLSTEEIQQNQSNPAGLKNMTEVL